jgi:hypothetical protein
LSFAALKESKKLQKMNNGLSRQSSVIICPGIHDPQLTQDFLAGLYRNENGNLPSRWAEKVLIFPTQDYPAYSSIHILEFLQHRTGLVKKPVIFVSFSAGVPGAIGAAWGWQLWGATVKAFIAIDGWGVPLYGDFPIHRLSHDYFTHWSSALLGSGQDSFYADPAIEHLDLWRSPDLCQGWWVRTATFGTPEHRTFTTAAQFITQLLHRYT